MSKGKRGKSLEIEFTCPLGSECDEIRDNKRYKCMWHTKVQGLDPNTGEELEDWSCAISWMPSLQIEQGRINRGQVRALESFRNETVKGQSEFNQILSNGLGAYGKKEHGMKKLK